MGSFENPFSSSPVLALPAQHPHQSSFNMDSNRPSFSTIFPNGTFQTPATSSWSDYTSTKTTPRSAAGRKRSREEAGSNLDEDYFAVQAPAAQPEPENEDDWEYGPGMTLIKKGGKEYIVDSSSQTQDWLDQEAAARALPAALPEADEAPVRIRAAKIQRLNLSATPVVPEEPSSIGVAASPGSPERHSEPTVDDFTRHLGIGWSSINNLGDDIQAAARGWSKFIENHFPVTNAKIRLTSKGLASYLVEANEGYFLFAEDLRQGRLVSNNLERTWANLSSPVPIFDSDLVMEAGQTPKLELTQTMDGGAEDSKEKPVIGVTNDTDPPSAVVTQGQLIDRTSKEMECASRDSQSYEVEMDMS
ncbi:hypothetical protein QTJ16_000719 [Diplocarpon rosae]|uniref:Uncharacterized protein n=1 Tax=Diplocarpon rosae TaxID=946125 RepID=A0AAD9WHT3_9HELO|nr:hypothetical protein QTJ16_000719 [Diplocarpon rosae]PBP17986.1 hypothetical protein BUE80_DR011216 [Diplocarpon rosae]